VLPNIRTNLMGKFSAIVFCIQLAPGHLQQVVDGTEHCTKDIGRAMRVNTTGACQTALDIDSLPTRSQFPEGFGSCGPEVRELQVPGPAAALSDVASTSLNVVIIPIEIRRPRFAIWTRTPVSFGSRLT
jgi:hypothetical protein